MRSMLVIAILAGTTVVAVAGEDYSDYRDYFDEKPVTLNRSKHKEPRRRSHSVQDIDTRRYGDASARRNPSHLRPGHWNGAGFYVLPEYTMHPRGPVGYDFGSSSSDAYGSFGATNPFGGLGSRR